MEQLNLSVGQTTKLNATWELPEGTTIIFDDLGYSQNVILGDEEDDVQTAYDILNDILTYFNLNIIQHGKDFYIFSWETLSSSQYTLTFADIFTQATKQYTARNRVDVLAAMYADASTNISIDDVYNQVIVTDNIQALDTIVSDPLDKTSSVYGGKQLYATDFVSEGQGVTAHNSFNNMLNGRSTTYDKAYTYDYYLDVRKPEGWAMNSDAIISDNPTHQNRVLADMRSQRFLAAVVSMGSVKKQPDVQDNTISGNVSMNDYVMISVNGCGPLRNENDAVAWLNDTENELAALETEPMMQYTGNTTGASLSPVDDDTVNYLVISGTMRLNPLHPDSLQDTLFGRKTPIIYNEVYAQSESDHEKLPFAIKYYTDRNPDGCVFGRLFYDCERPNSIPVADKENRYEGLTPVTDETSWHGGELYWRNHPQALLRYDNIDHTDDIYLLPVLKCELKVGDKYCVQTYENNGMPRWSWCEENECPTAVDSYGDTYTEKYIYIGPNIALYDNILNKEWKLCNTKSINTNIDGEGMCIPIRKADALSGQVSFKIIGPVNLMWQQYVYRHGSFWRHSSSDTVQLPMLAYIDTITLKDFKITIESDNAGLSNEGDNDIVYASDETRNYRQKLEVEFNLTTQLSSADANQLGVASTVNLNSVINMNTKIGQTTIYNSVTQNTACPERHYVNDMYNLYNTPRLLLNTSLKDVNGLTPFSRCNIPYMSKMFYITNMGYDIKNARKNITLRQIPQ